MQLNASLGSLSGKVSDEILCLSQFWTVSLECCSSVVFLLPKNLTVNKVSESKKTVWPCEIGRFPFLCGLASIVELPYFTPKGVLHHIRGKLLTELSE